MDYYIQLADDLDCICVKDQKTERVYKVAQRFGRGWLHFFEVTDYAIVLLADLTLSQSFEKVVTIKENFVEIGLNNMETGIRSPAYINLGKRLYTYCEAKKPMHFVRLIITNEAIHKELLATGHVSYDDIPDLFFIFQQMRDMRFKGVDALFIESKVLEAISIIKNVFKKNVPISVRLMTKDRNLLNKVAAYLRDNPALYPSIEELAKMASMSSTRFQLAFRKHIGTTAYNYQKQMRLYTALSLLHNENMSIQDIALSLGYKNAGHFAGLFKKAYSMTPIQYRLMKRQ